MHTALRRLFVLSVLTGGTYAAWSWWQRQNTDDLGAAPEWPPLRVAGNGAPPEPAGAPAATVTAEVADVAEVAEAAPAAATNGRWVPATDGGCPDGFPVKVKEKSGIYHVPGGRFYDRTVPERCYARVDDAEADGYRAAKA